MAQTLELDYNAKVEDVEVYGINEYLKCGLDVDIDTGKPTAYVAYELQVEAREWGIKSISVFAKKVTISIDWETPTEYLTVEEKEALINAGGQENRNDTISGTITIDTTVKINDKDWNVESEVSFTDDGQLSIDTVSVELPAMSIVLL